MDLLTIGAFAKAAGLSPKALRLYNELALLVPATVDPVTGYRFYRPDQLERARFVSWLRRLGMPLAQIRLVCDLEPGQAATEVTAYWARVEADTAARRDLSASLVRWLSDQESASAEGFLTIDYAVRSDIGLVRSHQQDTAYAGERLLAVADGFGDAGTPASAGVVEALRRLASGTDLHPLQPADVLNALHDALTSANASIAELPRARTPGGTTLTAMLWTGSRLAVAHIGDSRAYVLRAGELFQITQDHSLVQFMIDSGRLTAEEAWSHPQRSLLMRALDGRGEPQVDVNLHDVRAGERYLLCSDGLSSVVPSDQIRTALVQSDDADAAVTALVSMAYDAGAPDNISCVVADIREARP